MSKTSKVDRRAQRKHKRSQHTLFRHEDVSVASAPTNHLVVSNGGLCNGVKREEIETLFSCYGKVVAIVMKSDKPYCFVTMESVTVAERVYLAMNGRLLKCPDELAVPGVTFYISYIHSVPGYETTVHNTLPPGLTIIKDFVSEEYEQRLVGCVDWETKDRHMLQESQQSLKHRRVKHYGYEFIYGINNVDVTRPLEHGIPSMCGDLVNKMCDLGLRTTHPDQLTINEYQPGQGIPPHIDTHSAFDDVIVALSLGSQAVMDFKHPDGRHIPVLLPRRSLLVMAGEARYVWTHGITPRKSDIVPVSHTRGASDHETEQNDGLKVEASLDSSSNDDKLTLVRRGVRTSFTFRKVLREPCKCVYKEQCDSQQVKSAVSNVNTDGQTDGGGIGEESRPAIPINEGEAQKLEERLVHQVYEEIAGHFSDTRHSPWPKVVEFLRRHPPGSVILDIGCGNGKYLGANDSCYKIGCDRSVNLCSISHHRGFPVFVSDCLYVPVREGSVDVVISIAVIHHLSTQERRLTAMKEIVKVLRPGGEALIYVWALEQELNKQKSNYLKESKMKENIEEKEHVTVQCSSSCDKGIDEQKTVITGANITDLSSENSAENVNHASSDVQNESETKENESETTQYLPVHVNRTPFVSQDLLVPWHLKGKQKVGASNSDTDKQSENKESVFHRFYHVFKQGELEELCYSIDNVKVIQSYYDKGNWCTVLQKL